MGIKGLRQFLAKKSPELFQEISLSEYAYKHIAIDVSLYMCTYKASLGPNWLEAFVRLVCILRQYEVHPVFIYDTRAPPEKQAERKERASSRERASQRLDVLLRAMETYHNDGIVDETLLEFQKKRGLEIPSLTGRPVLNVNGVQATLDKMNQQLFTITPEDFALTKQLFTHLGIPFIDTHQGEAEKLCADLVKQNRVAAVLTEDTDVLAYGASVWLSKINTSTGKCRRVFYDDVLRVLEYSPEQFLDFCILCGTDYNKNIPGIGPVKAYSLIQIGKQIEELGKVGIDTTILNYKRVRELFGVFSPREYDIPFCQRVDNWNLVEEFLFRNNVKVDIISLQESLLVNRNIEIVE
jgi:5'-3' exonuclease